MGLLGFEVSAQLVDVVRSSDEEVAVGPPTEIAGRFAAGAGPGFPVLDDVERVLRQQDVLGPGEQLPDPAGALAGRGLGVGRVGLDQHDVETGIGLGEVQRGRGPDDAAADDDDRPHLESWCWVLR